MLQKFEEQTNFVSQNIVLCIVLLHLVEGRLYPRGDAKVSKDALSPKFEAWSLHMLTLKSELLRFQQIYSFVTMQCRVLNLISANVVQFPMISSHIYYYSTKLDKTLPVYGNQQDFGNYWKILGESFWYIGGWVGIVELSKSILICKSAIEIQRRLSRGYMGVRGESKRDLTNAPFGDSHLL